jgi:hypothetical protein
MQRCLAELDAASVPVPADRLTLAVLGRGCSCCRGSARTMPCTVPELVARWVSCGFAVQVDDVVVMFRLVY